MKATLRIIALLAVLGFAGQPSHGLPAAPNGSCGYYCGTTFYWQNVGTSCCSHTFTCPNGQQVPAWGVANSGNWFRCLTPP